MIAGDTPLVLPAHPGRESSPQNRKGLMLVNLNAKSDFLVGDKGRVTGHTVMKIDSAEGGAGIVVATQNVTKGMNGWFERQP